ncbi:alkene reductase [Phenylobacterium soli]|nr:alkene reductase [Phenylobacterium soli]
MTDLFDPCEFNGVRLKNRIALSPLTRTRSNDAGEAGELQALYYAQRASAGLLITEATPVTPGGRGGPFIPGLWSDDQIAGWRQVTDAVHAKGGVIFCQLWHAGRLSHSSLSGGEPPVAPSAMRQPGQIFTAQGLQPYEEARALRLDEMQQIVELFRAAAVRAKQAGFDGVELHAAHSYLIDAFLRDMTNKRNDAYGGSIENRARLLVEVLQAIIGVWGPERTAIRLAPIGHAYQAWDSDPEPLFTYVVERLNELKVGWLDLVEGDTGISRTAEPSFDLQKLRRLFKGALIANNLYDRDMAIAARAADTADIIAFGRPFIANPDLVERLRQGAPLAVAPPAAYYGGGARGYTDWPTLEEAAAKV